jgi:thiosulfate/3-mercaptopyruvate sulfurtransferase
MTGTSPFVTASWLSENLGKDSLVVLDGTYFLPVMKRDAAAEFVEGHIPGAQFCDLEAISDPDKSRPHMLADNERFSTAVGSMGISNDDLVVIYDQSGLFSAPRLWWTFRVYGHENVKILEGGLKAWKSAGLKIESGMSATHTPKTFSANLDEAQVRDAQDMLSLIETKKEQIVDARSRGRFAGTDAEPWPGRVPGHMDGAFNLPHVEVINAETQTLRSVAEIRTAFEAEGVDLAKPIVTSCGSGVTASTLALALHVAGVDSVAIYDASWSEWGLPDNGFPIVSGS